MSSIEFRNVVKRFGANEVIPRLNLRIPSGALTVLLGPSGCGKSTLLRMVAGLETPDEGQILLDGADITDLEPGRRNMAMVFQNYALYPHLSVRQNLAFPLDVAKIPKGIATQKVAETARLLGLTPMLDRFPRTLSGGERQRTAVGRAIIREPVVFLFDEPLSNLDFQLRNQMRAELKSLQQRLGKTSIYVTHDQTEAMTMADHLVVLNKGQIVQTGPAVEVFRRPANLFVARFIGSPPMNIMDVKIDGGNVGVTGANAPLTSLSVPDGLYRLGIRPDQLLATKDVGNSEMTVEQTEFHGTATYLIGKVGNHTLMALNSTNQVIEAGDLVSLEISPRICHLFDAASDSRIIIEGQS